MPDAQPAPPAKNPLLSKTLWLQVVTMLSLLFPAVREWLASNPESFVAVVAAVNVLLRFTTKGAITIFHGGNEPPTGVGGATLCMAAALILAMGALPSCAAFFGSDVAGTLFYRDPGTGAKAGLAFVPGQAVAGFLRVPIYDPETGLLTGYADVRTGQPSAK